MSKSHSKNRRVVILRHGERVDFTFGLRWLRQSFNESMEYKARHPNMPESLPPRALDDWAKDTPLTVDGCVQAQLVGESLKKNRVKFAKVIVSPSFRCVTTAAEVLKAMGACNDLPMNVEYGMFEWLGWYRSGMPNWMSENELAKMFNINRHYQPFVSRQQLEETSKENLDDLYNRCTRTMRKILKETEGDLLVVAHANNLETCTRQLIGKPTRSWPEVGNILTDIPYLGAIAMQEIDDGVFKFIDPPCLTMPHNAMPKFDWRDLQDSDKFKL